MGRMIGGQKQSHPEQRNNQGRQAAPPDRVLSKKVSHCGFE